MHLKGKAPSPIVTNEQVKDIPGLGMIKTSPLTYNGYDNYKNSTGYIEVYYNLFYQRRYHISVEFSGNKTKKLVNGKMSSPSFYDFLESRVFLYIDKNPELMPFDRICLKLIFKRFRGKFRGG